MKHRLAYIIKSIPMMALALGLLSAPKASAFSTSTYTTNSVLAEGHWVKVAVEESGMHFVSAASLRSWGFPDPTKVRVFGYGGNRIDDVMSLANYVDDLPEVQCHASEKGVYFYGEGPTFWTIKSNGRHEHTTNPFSTAGYYYLTNREGSPRTIPANGTAVINASATTQFTEHMLHEQDIKSLSESGHMLVGEDLKYNPNPTFKFNFTNRVEGTNVTVRSAFVTNANVQSKVQFFANGTQVAPEYENKISSVSGSNYGTRATFVRNFTMTGDKLDLQLKFIAGDGVTNSAHLDFIELNYTRSTRLTGGQLDFYSTAEYIAMDGVNTKVYVWDVTDPCNVTQLKFATEGTRIGWRNSYSGKRHYAVWSESGSLPSAKYVGAVGNQNLHGITDNPDMVIITLAEWKAYAEQIADLHRNSPDRLNVKVVDQELIFNEFSSGTHDVNSFRRFLKMLYDRGNAAGKPLRFALLMGRPTYDNRVITPQIAAMKQKFMPTWQTDESLVETSSYTSDDVFAFLEDGAGNNKFNDRYSIAVGRIPVHSASQAKDYVAKLTAYINNQPASSWKNQVLTVADNGDQAAHMKQAETMQANIAETSQGDAFLNKVYVDAFDLVGGVSIAGRDRMYRLLHEGTLLWTYIGHASKTYIGGENLLLQSDIDNLYLDRLPFFVASTCSFSQWDGSSACGNESLFFHPKGGAIATLGATRKALIADNGLLTDELGNYVFRRDEDGRYPTIGEVIQRAKNQLASPAGKQNENKLLYVLMGDPAMRLAIPNNRVKLTTINGASLDGSDDVVVQARQTVTVTGAIYDPSGTNVLTDFNGTLTASVYDAEYSTTTKGVNGSADEKITFEQQGSKLCVGIAEVTNGQFTLTLSMPSEIADNYRPAAMNLYAVTSDKSVDAIGCNRAFFVSGYDDSAAADEVPPVIEAAYLNHGSFTSGGIVNSSPTFIANVSDNVGINLSSAGVGHQMTIKLDERRSFSDVSLYYTPAADGSPSGQIVYPLNNLTEGRHTLTFRVWDTSSNSSTHTFDFEVSSKATPKIFDIYTDVNPASTEANFYVTHNRPNAIMKVTITVYNLMGRQVWSATNEGPSDMFLSAPVTWNLHDMGGHRVNRGIYIYRATIEYDGQEETSIAKRLAVTGK